MPREKNATAAALEVLWHRAGGGPFSSATRGIDKKLSALPKALDRGYRGPATVEIASPGATS